MILELIMHSIYTVVELFTRPINIPAPDESVVEVIYEMFSYLQAGMGILANYMNVSLVFTILGIVIVIDLAIGIYHFIMWIIRKVPMISVS